MNLYIDADVLVYEAAFSAQKTRYRLSDRKMGWCDDFDTLKAYLKDNNLELKDQRERDNIEKHIQVLPASTAKMILKQKYDAIKNVVAEKLGKKPQAVLHLSGATNFRDKVALTRGYKANRADVERPQHYSAMRTTLLQWGAIVTDDQEADDAIGIANQSVPGVIATIDKDLNMLPGKHYDWNKQLAYTVQPFDAMRFFCTQLITGDSTDNIPGLPAYGAKAAEKLLAGAADEEDMLERVVLEYRKGPFKFKDGTLTSKDTQAYLVEQMNLLWIRRKEAELVTPAYIRSEYCK